MILMTRFRNRIIHLYWDIDDKLVFKIIKENCDDFQEFKIQIKNFISTIEYI